VSIHQPLRKLGRSVIHINIGVARIVRDGNLNRGRALKAGADGPR
jgi:hypothetical protein